MLRFTPAALGGGIRRLVPSAASSAAASIAVPRSSKPSRIGGGDSVPAVSASAAKTKGKDSSATLSALLPRKLIKRGTATSTLTAKPTPTSVFDVNRALILANLGANAKDRSIRGGVDPLIAPLVDLINGNPNYCTLSSCSGRISLFHRIQSDSAAANKIHMKRGAGKGFLFVSHDPIGASVSTTAKKLVALAANAPEIPLTPSGKKKGNQTIDADGDVFEVLQFKFEPTILHVMCRTMEDAHRLLVVATQSGHRQAGIVVSRAGKRVGTKAEKRQREEAKKSGTLAPVAPFASDEWKISVQMSSKVCFDAPLYDSRGGGWVVGGFDKAATSKGGEAAALICIKRLLTVGDSLFIENGRRRDRFAKLFREL